MPTYRCPTCRTVVSLESRQDLCYRPFCTERCQLIDLYHWFEGDYRISDPLASDADLPQPGRSEDRDGADPA